MVAAPI